MMHSKHLRASLAITACLLPCVAAPSASTLYPVNQQLYDQYRWSVLYYYGQTVSNSLYQVLKGDWRKWPENIQSLELAYTLHEDNIVRKFFNPVVGVIQIAANTTVRYGKNEHTIYEFDPYIVFRWANFPWNNYLTTSFALSEGVSYDTSIPSIEKRNNTDTKRLLNYLFVEATFASPNNPCLQLVARIHHRSGVFGMYHAGNTGSNVVGAGIRYLFN